MMLYRESAANKKPLANQVFKKFTDAVGHGTPEEFANILYGRYVVEDFALSDDWKYWAVHGYFLEKVIPHKIAVFFAGERMARNSWFFDFIGEGGDMWFDNLYLHDLSKFSANESWGYAQYDFKTGNGNKDAFERAWHHHKMHNEHHPEYWLNPNRSGELEVLPMPKIYIAEMVADWIGAGETYGSSLEEWLPKNLHKFKFHKKTAAELHYLLGRLGIKEVEALTFKNER